MWYKLDIRRLAVQMLPPVLRSRVMVALLYVLTTPLKWINAKFKAAKDETDAAVETTCTVASLEAGLNKLFYLRYGQIYIDTPEWTERATVFYKQSEDLAAVYMHEESEGKPTYLTDTTEDQPEENFTVMVPTFLCTSLEKRTADKYGWKNLAKIKQFLNKYKPAGRQFGIKLYDYE